MSGGDQVVLVVEELLDPALIQMTQRACDRTALRYRAWPGHAAQPGAERGAVLLGGLATGSRSLPPQIIAASQSYGCGTVVLFTDEELDHHHVWLHDGAVSLVPRPTDDDELGSVLRQALAASTQALRDTVESSFHAREFWARGLWAGYVATGNPGTTSPAGLALDEDPHGLPAGGHLGATDQTDIGQVLALARSRIDGPSHGAWLPEEIRQLCADVTLVGLTAGSRHWKLLRGCADHETWLMSRRRIPARSRLRPVDNRCLTLPAEPGDLLIADSTLSAADRTHLHDLALARGGAVAFAWLQQRIPAMHPPASALLMELL